MYITSPATGRQILVGGPTYNKLMLSKKFAAHLTKAKKTKAPKTKAKGCSNQGRYTIAKGELFCGPSGGACPGTYPVNTPGRARAALAYARYSPNPDAIRRCVFRVAKAKGWIVDGKLKVPR